MANVEKCFNCKWNILTIEQMQTTKLCDICGKSGKRHAEEFHEKYDIRDDNNK